MSIRLLKKSEINRAKADIAKLIEDWIQTQDFYVEGSTVLSDDTEAFMAEAAVNILVAVNQSQVEAVGSGDLREATD